MLAFKHASSSLYQQIPPQGQAADAGALRPSLTRDLLEATDPVSLAAAHPGQFCAGEITECSAKSQTVQKSLF